MDLIVGNTGGEFRYILNNGTSTAPVFVQIGWDSADNPLDGIEVGEDSTPAFADIDNDGTLGLCPSIDINRDRTFFCVSRRRPGPRTR